MSPEHGNERCQADTAVGLLGRVQMPWAWNNATRDCPHDVCLHELIERQAERTPEAAAAIFDGRSLTYRELNERANQLARYLQSLGAKPETLVGIYVERSLEMIVGVLGILKSGGAYVPLDPAYPKERLRLILEDARIPLLLTQRGLQKDLPTHNAKAICLDSDWGTISREDTAGLLTHVAVNNLAYVIYTSGSTGKPKGVAIEHHSPVNLVHWAKEIFSREHLAGVLAATSLCFDLSVFELFVPLCWGGTVILARNILDLPAMAEAGNVTLINTVPSAMMELLRVRGIPASVRTVNLAGEALTTTLVRDLYQIPTIQNVYDLYGPTETTTYSTFALRSGSGPATIGRPIANTQIYILEPTMQPTSAGQSGEIYIGGDGVARGYLNRPELTQARFVPDRFSGQPGARLYKTGDLGRCREDGHLEFLGRIDHQVKIRGFRIELGEIESVLVRHPSVRKAVVAVDTDESGVQRLVAYVMVAEKVLATSELRHFLREALPEYMIPATFVVLSQFPLTPNGKVDRRALPEPKPSCGERQEKFMEPRDPLELQLVSMWESILGMAPIGIRDNFFDLGGHSLHSVRLFAEIETLLDKNLPLATLLQAPTIEQLADILRQEEWAPPWSSLVPLQTRGTLPPLFCVHANGGNVLSFIGLVRRLGADQPLYGLQAVGLDGKQTPLARIEDMASHYLQEIGRLQPGGPYYLCGLSLGGVVAFDMAQQLLARGEEVAFVGLLDSDCPGYIPPILHRLLGHLRELRHLGMKDKLKYVRTSVARAYQRLTDKSAFNELPRTLRTMETANLHALRRYVPKSYPGRITLFRARERPVEDHDPRLSWGKLLGHGLEIRHLPGHHGNFYREPNILNLADELRFCLERARLGFAANAAV